MSLAAKENERIRQMTKEARREHLTAQADVLSRRLASLHRLATHAKMALLRQRSTSIATNVLLDSTLAVRMRAAKNAPVAAHLRGLHRLAARAKLALSRQRFPTTATDVRLDSTLAVRMRASKNVPWQLV